jgi:hypothetical protein
MATARLLGTCVLALAISGCGLSGFLYTNVTVPLDLNLDATPLVEQDDDRDVKTFQYYIRVDWGDASIGTIAKENGFEKVHYADLRTLRVLGVWTQRFVTIYGVRKPR